MSTSSTAVIQRLSPYRHHGAEDGFTLIELAVVIAIVGLLLGGLLVPLATQVDIRRARATQEALQETREALYGFALVNNRLPCPDCRDDTGGCDDVAVAEINDGREDREAGGNQLCQEDEGNLPWVTLGSQELDAWARRYRYRVTPAFADNAVAPELVSFDLASIGGIDIDDADGNAVAREIPAVVLSLGPNGADAPTSATELENTDDDDAFVASVRRQDPGSEFDDILIWVSPMILKNKMVSAAKLP